MEIISTVKYQIVQFESGMYGVQRKETSIFGKVSIKYLDLSTSASSNKKWIGSDGYSGQCFSSDLRKVQIAFMETCQNPGLPLVKNQMFSLDDVNAMNTMAEKDEGLRDLMLKAKEFYLLKKK